jgi:DNA-binding GntR family transcriptional regulator
MHRLNHGFTPFDAVLIFAYRIPNSERDMDALPRQTTILDSVYAAIRDSICDGAFMPGERLTQDDIAERLGVSRQPVGQALILLKSQAL